MSLRVLRLGLDGFWKLEGEGMEQGHALFFLNVQFFVAHLKNLFLQAEVACMGRYRGWKVRVSGGENFFVTDLGFIGVN